MAPECGHILAGLSRLDANKESFDVLLQTPGAKIERIVSPPGTRTPADQWLEEETDEFVFLVEGRARLEVEGSSAIDLNPGDHLRIRAGCRHRVAWTDDHHRTIWLAVHC